MSRNDLVLGLIVAVAVATSAVVAGSTLGKAQNHTDMNHAQSMHSSEAAMPTMPGQEAFGTIQEIVRILEADPTTDWSKVNIAALREHLIDMEEVTMRVVTTERQVRAGHATRSSAWCRLILMSSWRSAGRRGPRICPMA